MKLAGRYAVITGAGRGLGAEVARKFIAEGASVLLCARSGDELEKQRTALTLLAGPGQQVITQVADIAKDADVTALFGTARASFPRLDVLVNNAGVVGPIGAVEDVDWQEWVEAVQINLMGTVACCREAVPLFKAQGYGKIINVSGGGATSPMPRMSAYAASKAALVRFTETLARELQDWHVDVNAVAPGTLATEMNAGVLEAGPDQVGREYYDRLSAALVKGGVSLDVPASLCTYLASAESDGITGRLISAPWDPWPFEPSVRSQLGPSDIYTLRRIVPADRGVDWGERRA